MHGGQTMPLFVHMLDTVRTGTPVPILREGKTRWEQLAEDPEQSAIFNRAMRGRATALAAVLSEVDWSGTTHVVDVGGGIGGVLLPVLRKHTHVRGTLFDLDHIADDARAAIADAGLTDRCDFVAGSFFESVPEGADAYVLSNILHDWNDDDSGRILATCRAAVRDDSRLLVLENLVPPGDDRHPVKVLDLQMMVALGGRERTEDEYRELLRAHGFTLVRVTGAAPAALEATPS
jgi:hypothetical protein